MSQDKAVIEKDTIRIKDSDFKFTKKLLLFCRDYKVAFCLALLGITSSSVCVAFSAYFLGRLVDEGIQAKNFELTWIFAGAVLIAEICGLAFRFGGRFVLVDRSSKVIYKIRIALIEKLSRLPIPYYDRQPQGRIVTRLTHDVEGIDQFFSSTLSRVLMATMSLVSLSIAMIIANYKLGLLLLIAFIPAAAMAILTRNPIRKLNRKMSKESAAINAQLNEYLNGLESIRSFAAEKWALGVYDQKIRTYLSTAIRFNRFNSSTRPLVSSLCLAPLFLLFYLALGQSALTSALSLGVLVSFIRYCERIYRPILTLAHELHHVQHAFTCTERVFQFLSELEEEEELKATKFPKASKLDGTIEFKNVSMAYPSQQNLQAIKNINFKIAPGSKVGFVGASGSGKSTCIKVLARTYDYQEGQVCINGQELQHYPREVLQKDIAFVSQDVVIFRSNLRENLCLGEEVSDQELLKQCESSGLLAIMQNRGLTLDSELEDQGKNLSVGERQLLAFTRVLLRDPKLIVLDEASANIDHEHEELMHQALHKNLAGRSAILVAHRLETLKECDYLLVFRDGQIVERGSHIELIEKRGYFFELMHEAKSQESLELGLNKSR